MGAKFSRPRNGVVSQETIPSPSIADVGNIVIISFKMGQPFISASAKEKIDALSKQIKLCCQKLELLFPDAMWIIGWPEYGITGKQFFSSPDRFISVETLNYFKQEMLKLTSLYPKLTIVAGTVAVKRHDNYLEYQKRRSHYLQGYKNCRDILKIEKKVGAFPLTSAYEKMVKNLKPAHVKKTGVDVISNTAYIFEKKIYKHRKLVLWYELKSSLGKSFPPNTIYRMPRAKTKNAYFVLSHPITKKKEISIGIEICREHSLGIFKKTSPQKPLLHIVVSDSVQLNSEFMYGQAAVQFDPRFETKLMPAPGITVPNIQIIPHDISTSTFLRVRTEEEKISASTQQFYLIAGKIIVLLNEAMQVETNKSSYSRWARDKFWASLFGEKDILEIFQELKTLLMDNLKIIGPYDSITPILQKALDLIPPPGKDFTRADRLHRFFAPYQPPGLKHNIAELVEEYAADPPVLNIG